MLWRGRGHYAKLLHMIGCCVILYYDVVYHAMSYDNILCCDIL